jgi:apolipoprotein N-acyltransferase
MQSRYSGRVTRFPKTLCLILGGVSATGFAPLGYWLFTLIAFALMMRSVSLAEKLRSALARGYWFGVGHFCIGLNWIAGAFAFQDKMPMWLGWFAVGALSLYIAVYPAVAAGLAWRWGRVSAPAPITSPLFWLQNRYALFFAAAWIVTEWLRATMFTGFAWNPLGLVLIDSPLGGGVSRTIGTYGLSAFVILFAGLLAVGFQPWTASIRAHVKDGTWPTILLGAPLMAFASLFVFAWIIALPGKTGAAKPANKLPLLHIVQPNIGQQDKHNDSFDVVNFGKLAELTGLPAKEPRLILWPEAAVPEYLEEEIWARERIAELMGPRDMLMTGGTALIYDKKNLLSGARNSVFAMTPQAKLIARYDKAHLVPYGEYLPMRPILSRIGLSRLVPGDIDFIPGPGAQSYGLPGFGKVGVQLCYEIIFSGEVVDRKNRPDFLFNPSNDAWFGPWGPPQHLAQARLRAIEEGLPIVRATPTGISAVIDSNGWVIAQLPYRKAGVISTRLPVAHEPTLFARVGNLLSLAFAALLTMLGIAQRPRLR